jgi:hypothetical protein
VIAASAATASSSLGLPRRVPRALAALKAALVRSEIISRSCCATAARICTVSYAAIRLPFQWSSDHHAYANLGGHSGHLSQRIPRPIPAWLRQNAYARPVFGLYGA